MCFELANEGEHKGSFNEPYIYHNTSPVNRENLFIQICPRVGFELGSLDLQADVLPATPTLLVAIRLCF